MQLPVEIDSSPPKIRQKATRPPVSTSCNHKLIKTRKQENKQNKTRDIEKVKVGTELTFLLMTNDSLR